MKKISREIVNLMFQLVLLIPTPWFQRAGKSMEEKTLALAQTLARQSSIYSDTESPPGSPRSARTHASILQEKVQSFRSVKQPWNKYL